MCCRLTMLLLALKLATRMQTTHVLSPHQFKEAIHTYLPQFKSVVNHDAHEFCMALLQQLDVEIHTLDELNNGSKTSMYVVGRAIPLCLIAAFTFDPWAAVRHTPRAS